MSHAAPEDLVANGARWLGLRATNRVDMQPEEVWGAIKKSINGSMPVLSCGLAGAPEFCIIRGYDDESRRLHVLSYFQDEGQGEVPFQPWMGWNYEGYGRMPLVLLRRTQAKSPELEETLTRALRFSRGEGPLSRAAKERGIRMGLEAYDVWMESLKQAEGDLETKAFIMALNLNALLEARRTAGEFLQILAAMREDWRLPLMRASEHYRHQVSALAEARRVLYFPRGMPDEAASKASERMSDEGLRREYVRLLKLAKEEDLLSLSWIERAVEG